MYTVILRYYWYLYVRLPVPISVKFFSATDVYLFKLWQTNTCSIKKIITICYIVMYLYFTADNSEAETECKVTRSGKYEKVIAGYKKSSPDIN